MDLYSMPIDDITYEYLDAFLQDRHQESEILDYKGTHIADIEKLMAAFANTSGGLIFLGVEEANKSGRPALPAKGIELPDGEDGLRRRIHNKAFDAIYPPITPQIAVGYLPDSPDRAVVLIRIIESHETPHATDHRSKVYVRNDSQNRFDERQANLDQWERLRSRRKVSEDFRERLLANAISNLEVMQSLQEADSLNKPGAIMQSYAIPCYPDYPRIELNSLLEFAREARSNSRSPNYPNYVFPDQSILARPIADGVAILPLSEYDLVWVQINQYGMIHSGACIRPNDTPQTGQLSPESYWAVRFIVHIDAFLDYLEQVYSHFDLLRVKPTLFNVKLTIPPRSELVWDGGGFRQQRNPFLTGQVHLLDETLVAGALSDRRDDLVRESAKRLLWAGGLAWAAKSEEMDKAMKRIGLSG